MENYKAYTIKFVPKNYHLGEVRRMNKELNHIRANDIYINLDYTGDKYYEIYVQHSRGDSVDRSIYNTVLRYKKDDGSESYAR